MQSGEKPAYFSAWCGWVKWDGVKTFMVIGTHNQINHQVRNTSEQEYKKKARKVEGGDRVQNAKKQMKGK